MISIARFRPAMSDKERGHAVHAVSTERRHSLWALPKLQIREIDSSAALLDMRTSGSG